MHARLTIAAATVGGILWLAGGPARADAILTLSGPDSNSGAIDLTTATAAQYGGLISAGGVSGYSLWGLLGGSTPAVTTVGPGGTTARYGGITVSTPAGDNAKNAILRDYLIATDASGHRSVISLGEIDPMFAGSAASDSDLVSVSGSTVSLDFLGAGAAGRDLTDVTSLQLLSVPALPGPVKPASESTAVTLSGNVGAPGSYGLSQLEGSFPATTETVNGDTYTGVPLWSLLDPTDSDIRDQYVVASATDGYEVVYSLAELDPALGGNPGDLLPYADTGGDFPGSGVARTLLPADVPFAHGRWVSNVDAITVAAVPEPAGLALLLPGALGLLALRRRRRAQAGA